MNRKQLISWVAGIPLLVIILIIIIVANEPKRNGISRAAACKAVALLMTDRESCSQAQQEHNQSFFPAKEQDGWYVKYMDYLYRNELLSVEAIPATSQAAEGFLTYQEAKHIAETLIPDAGSQVIVNPKNKEQIYPAEKWWSLYDSLCTQMESGDFVESVDVLLYGTPKNIKEASAWTSFTNKGSYGFEGLSLDYYIDHEIKVLVRGNEIIRVVEDISDSVTYRNIWVTKGEKDSFYLHMGSVKRELAIDRKSDNEEDFDQNLADVSMVRGKLQKITLKKEKINGRVLAVRDHTVEIEGYGKLEMDQDFKVYKVYGNFEQQSISDILVGYDIQEFVVADGRLCAALTIRAFDAKNIRVLLMDSEFRSVFHPSVTLCSEKGMSIICNEEKRETAPGEEVTFISGDDLLNDGRLVIEPLFADSPILVKTINRAQGNPSYSGTIEVMDEPDGLLLINDLYLEEYLTKVVPSEMPSSYEKEALKAQAVCARTYAYRQIQGNAYSRYGAHVDDSTKFQVYNNITTDSKTEAAVNETYGKMLFYQDKPIEAFYFSTSCGHTTDGSIWGQDPSRYPYLEGVVLKEGEEELNLSTNSDFTEFIKDKSYSSYDSSYPMYRWEFTTTNLHLQEKIEGVGTILNVTVMERGVGGIVKKLRVEGSEGTKIINGEGQVRAKLGNSLITIKKNDGKELTGWDSLPSAFIAIENEGMDDKNITRFHVYGGGYGHGVGMSQNGAQGMAKTGKNYEEILSFFYHGAQVKELANDEAASEN